MNKFLLACVPLILFGCSSTPKLGDRAIERDETLSTLNDTSAPSWANEGKPYYQDGSTFYSVGVTTMYGNERPEAGMRVAENSSRVNFSKHISDQMETVFQSVEENGSMSGTSAHYIGSEVSKLTTHSMKIEGYWYKRYASTQEDGRHIYYKIYALTSMPVKDLQAAMDQAISGKENEHKLSADFKAKADAQFSKILGIETPKVEIASKSAE